MPIRWSAVKVSQAADRIEELVDQATPILKEALAVAEEVREIDNLPGYMTGRFGRLAFEIKQAIGGVVFGHEEPGRLRACIVAIREAIPADAIEEERETTRQGETMTLF